MALGSSAPEILLSVIEVSASGSPAQAPPGRAGFGLLLIWAPPDLGSSPQVCGHDFQAGALGPSTIVGSAAFNMFVIIAICVYVVPDGETRKIKHLRVFFVTAAWSIFAYIWLYLILSVFSPGEVAVRTG